MSRLNINVKSTNKKPLYKDINLCIKNINSDILSLITKTNKECTCIIGKYKYKKKYSENICIFDTILEKYDDILTKLFFKKLNEEKLTIFHFNEILLNCYDFNNNDIYLSNNINLLSSSILNLDLKRIHCFLQILWREFKKI